MKSKARYPKFSDLLAGKVHTPVCVWNVSNNEHACCEDRLGVGGLGSVGFQLVMLHNSSSCSLFFSFLPI